MFWNRKTKWNLRTTLTAIAILLVMGIGNAKADFIFGTPTNLGPKVNSSKDDPSPSISADGLELYFESQRSGSYGSMDIWVTTRANIDDEWGEATNLGSTINSSGWEGGPCIFPDGLTLYFVNERDGIVVTRRATRSDNWGSPVALGPPINPIPPNDSVFMAISFDGLELYIGGYIVPRPGGFGRSDLWMSTRSDVSDVWDPPLNLGPTVNSSYHDRFPSISADGLTLFFNSNRPGGQGSQDIWVTTRVTKDDDWGTPVNLGPIVNSSYLDEGPCISADGRTLYFNSTRPGASTYRNDRWDLWQTRIEPVVDFNGDGIVDVKDVVILTDHWGENYSLCDIGPTPLGDGIVDVQDLEVLTKYIEPIDRTLIAHWTLDESEGATALDSAGGNLGYVMGDPVWQPDTGQVDGAIQLDGVDDVIVAGPPLNPADGPLSVLAWVKGGAPGQSIISEPSGPDWLSLDPLTGHLMTELTSGGRSATPLQSQAVITDGNWHRIGFVWDGSSRIIYVDGVAVAQDTQDALENTGNGFYIGTGKDMAAGTFFWGLIDDVRIYNRALNATVL